MSQRNVRPIIRQNPALEWSGKTKKSPHKRSKNTDDEPPDHDKHMSSRQIFGHIWKKSMCEAQTPPTCTQPIWDVVGSWVRGKRKMGYDLVVGRGEKTYFAAPAQALLGGTSCWDDKPPKRGKVEGGTVRCMPWGKERESIYVMAGKSTTVDWQMKQTCLCLVRVSGTQTNPLVVGKYA